MSDTEEDTHKPAGINLREAMAAFQQRTASKQLEGDEEGSSSAATPVELPPLPKPASATVSNSVASPVEQTGLWVVCVTALPP